MQEDAPSTISNTPPLLKEVSLPLETILASEDDSGKEEKTIVESPHHDAITSSPSLESTNCDVESLCDDHAHFPSDSNVSDVEQFDLLPCSCDEHTICVDCIDQKCHLLAKFREQALHNPRDNVLTKHGSFEEGESSPSASVDDKFESGHSLGLSETHVLHDFALHSSLSPTPQVSEDTLDDFKLITSPLVDACLHKFSHSQTLSCDLAPDILALDCNTNFVGLSEISEKAVVPCNTLYFITIL